MNSQTGIPKEAIVSISDMLDHCAKIKPDDEVLILAQIDGLYGGDTMGPGCHSWNSNDGASKESQCFNSLDR